MPAVSQQQDKGILQALETNGTDNMLDQLIEKYESTVFTLAMHLTGNEDAAKEATIEVFLRLSEEQYRQAHEPIDTLIHRFTYDAALPLLLCQMEKNLDNVDSIGSCFLEPGKTLIC